MKLPEKFFEIAQTLGASPVFVQGGGGNLSFKDDTTLYVKASGYLLKDVAFEKGYVGCALTPIQTHLAQLEYHPRSVAQENEFNTLIEQSIIPKYRFGVPSIETGMHAILGTAVIHTHNVYVNVFGCSNGIQSPLHELFPDSLIIPYINPGLGLAHGIFLLKQQHVTLPPILFLANHGLIVHADTLDTAMAITLYVNEVLVSYIAQRKIDIFSVKNELYDFRTHLFPDSVVYSSIDFQSLSPEKQHIVHEISSASNYILTTSKKLGRTPCFFDPDDVHFIANMEREKHRMKMVADSNTIP